MSEQLLSYVSSFGNVGTQTWVRWGSFREAGRLNQDGSLLQFLFHPVNRFHVKNEVRQLFKWWVGAIQAWICYLAIGREHTCVSYSIKYTVWHGAVCGRALQQQHWGWQGFCLDADNSPSRLILSDPAAKKVSARTCANCYVLYREMGQICQILTEDEMSSLCFSHPIRCN